jgi:ABC-type phosphate transport system substrate-binding protein
MHRAAVSILAAIMLVNASNAFAEDIAVIANPERETVLDREELARIFLRKRRFWADGTAILPVNRDAGATIRAGFDGAVFGSRARRLSNYWNREYFRGVLPPATLASDEAVRRFVAREPRAIGYVRASVVDDSVAVILVLDDALP